VRFRPQALLGAAAAAALVAGGIALDRLGPRVEGPTDRASAVSGTWLCPHGGGADWTATITLVNPGPDPATARIRALGSGPPEAMETIGIAPGSQASVPVPADARGRGTVVDFFGSWVAAGWTAHAAGKERGTAMEPCVSRAAGTWLLADGTTVEGQNAAVVVMNPFAADAIFSLVAFTEDRRIRVREWSDVVLPAGRATSFSLNASALGEATVGVRLDVSLGRVATSSLGVSRDGGVRSAIGVPGPGAGAVYLPGGGDAGIAVVAALNPAEEGASLSAAVHAPGAAAPGGIPEEALPPGTAATFPLEVPDPSSIDVRAATQVPLAVVRRSVGTLGDLGATSGSPGPATAWVVVAAAGIEGGTLPTTTVYLTNPGTEAVTVTITPIPPGSAAGAGDETADPVTLEVPAASMAATVPVQGGSFLVQVDGEGAVVAGAGASSTDTGYALAAGVPVPTGVLGAGSGV
jgi:Family of unknown function (DUF5719)